MKKSKTVFILGAGFSYDCGAPLQSHIIQEILGLQPERHDRERYVTEVTSFKDFLQDKLNIAEKHYSAVPLEDVFTPLDRCILDGISFRGMSTKEARDMRDRIQYLIGVMMREKLWSPDRSYVNSFAEFLVERASVRRNGNYKNEDPVSVISMNWDILLDNAIKEVLWRYHNGDEPAVVDYCCNISSYQNDPSIKPGLEALGMGGFNVKLLKIHGSLNWIQCPRCLRLYVDFGEKIAVTQYVDKTSCKHCDKNFGDEEKSILEANMIMPTFLKNLSNTQLKMVWQNAGIELSEADRIVIMGYSLPQADFEMRQLLARMVRKDAQIIVVTSISSPAEFQALKTRYKTFFGRRKVSFFYRGVVDFVQEHLSEF